MTFFSVSASSLISKYQGESEQSIKFLFELARKRKPSVVFFDEIDAIGMARTNEDNDSARRIKTELFIQMDGMLENSGIFIIAATNTPYNLDGALLRRFDKIIYVPLPDTSSRYKMLQQKLIHEDIDAKDLEIIAKKSEGFSGSDIDKFCRYAKLQPIIRLQKANFFRSSQKDKGEIVHSPCEETELGAVKMNIDNIRTGYLDYSSKTSKEDVFNIFNRVKPTTPMSTIRKLDKFTSEVAFFISKAKKTEEEEEEKMPWWVCILYFFYELLCE